MNKKLFAAIVLFALVGCDEEQEVKTKDWYKSHDAERHERIAQCENDVKEKATADCQNALAAQADIAVFGR